MEQERRKNEFAVTNLVDHHATNNDAETKACKPGTTNRTQLGAREAEISRPVGQDAAPDAESDAGSQNGKESGPKEPFSIGRNALCEVCTH